MRILTSVLPRSKAGVAAFTLSALALTAPGYAQDAFEPNNDCNSAALISLGTTAGLTAGPDNDVFSVMVPPNAEITVNALDSSGNHLDVTIFESGCGASLASATGAELRFFDCGGTAREVLVEVSGTGLVDEAYTLEVVGAEILDDDTGDNDTCANAALFSISSFTTPGLVVTGCDEDFYVGRLQNSGVEIQIDLVFTHAQGDIDLELYNADCTTLLASSASMDDNESVRYMNTSSPSTPEDVVVRVFMKNGTDFGDYSLSACFGDEALPTIGNQACTAVPNSTGRPATLCARGSDVAADDTVFLYVVDLPSNMAGYFLTSPTLDIVMSPGTSVGNLCLGAPGRYDDFVLFTNGGSAVFFQPEIPMTPVGGGGVAPVMAGTSQMWQFWYRDTAVASTASNFSTALEISFN